MLLNRITLNIFKKIYSQNQAYFLGPVGGFKADNFQHHNLVVAELFENSSTIQS